MSGHEGYWYDTGAADTPLLRTGNRVKLADAPPWLVVDRSLTSIIVTARGWPGALWRARVLELGDMSGLVADPGYWRARALELVEPVPLARLFGRHGEQVLAVIARIATLSAAQAEALAAAGDPDGWRAYGRVWAHWATATRATPHAADDWDFVLSASRFRGDPCSPIDAGLGLIHQLLHARARAVDGDAGFVREADDDEPGAFILMLAPRWQGACAALLQAGLALGAPEHVAADDRPRLLRAWEQVFG